MVFETLSLTDVEKLSNTLFETEEFSFSPYASDTFASGERLEYSLLGLDSDTFYIYHVAAVMVDNLRRLLLGINLSDKAIMDFDFPGVGFPV